MRGTAMSLKASGFVIFLLFVPVIQGQDGWGVTYTSKEICALQGSTVDICCTFEYPYRINDLDTTVQARLWFTEATNNAPVDLRRDSDYTGRVEYHYYERNCTLRITDLRESDSTGYKFRFITNQPGGSYTGSPGVTLSVTDLQVQVGRKSPQLELKCHSSCNVVDHPSYVWYKNGEKMVGETSSYRVSVNVNTSYSCAVKGHEDYRSPPVYDPKPLSVSVSPSAEIVEGSSVTLSCSSDANPAAKYTWSKNNQYPDFPHSKQQQHFFRSIQSSDTGNYYCTAENELGLTTSEYIFINVKHAPKVVTVSVSPSGDILPFSSVTLSCSSDANPAAKYTWYKKNGNPNLQSLSKEPQLVFISIQSSDSGEYYCAAENKLGMRTSEYVFIDVKYAPKLSSMSVSPSGEIREGSSVTLTCSSDANPAANYTLYKGNGNLGRQPLSGKFIFSSIQSSDSGEYYCIAENKLGKGSSEFIIIDVKYAPKVPSVLVSPAGEIMEGSNVNLTCSSDANPAATCTCHKKNGNPGRQSPSKEPQLVFSPIQSSDSGEYYCIAENKLGTRTSEYVSIDVKYAPKLPSVSVSPSAEIVEGSSVTLTCSSDANPAATYNWYKENQTLLQGPEGSYHFTSISSEDRGIYHCKSENQYGWVNSSFLLNVYYPPKLPSVSVSPSAEIVEGSSVNLTCSSDANPAANYTWYKENQILVKGPEGRYHFNSISSNDRMNYHCKSDNQYGWINSSLLVNVHYAPKLPSVSVSPSAEIVEGSSVTLTCSSDANPAANYTWYKENGNLGRQPLSEKFVFSSIQSSDSGEYYCTAENKHGKGSSDSIIIDVKRPWKFILIAGAIAPAISLTTILVFILLWIIKKKASKQPSESGETPDNRVQPLSDPLEGCSSGSECPQIQLAEQQDDLHYASVRFSKKTADPIYSNIRSVPPRRHKEETEEEEMVEYSTVTFNSASAAWSSRGQEAAEDPAALYSTVNTPKKHGKRNF